MAEAFRLDATRSRCVLCSVPCLSVNTSVSEPDVMPAHTFTLCVVACTMPKALREKKVGAPQCPSIFSAEVYEPVVSSAPNCVTAGGDCPHRSVCRQEGSCVEDLRRRVCSSSECRLVALRIRRQCLTCPLRGCVRCLDQHSARSGMHSWRGLSAHRSR